ncbi:alpha/beta hydrolase [Bdellovibrio sp.]|uniref:alpha/beta hydrolase n=1 Tax=Bdellovibrio TaxID=958 RepID=UPI0032220280
MRYTELAQQELPFDGEFFLAREKKFEEVIFFVHFFEGSKKQLLRHIKLVNSWGFDAFAFQLQGDHKNLRSLKLPISAKGGFGLKHVYADQIESLLNLIPGKKIIFSFSNPSASAIEAMARRNCSDTVALVCDSGPSGRFLPSAYNLYTHEYKIRPLPLRLALTPVLSLSWSPFLHKDLHKDLATFPAGFRILSIRGWKDLLIPPEHIDDVFEPHTQLDWSKLSLPEAGHLTGLRDFKAEYAPTLEKFLKRVAQPCS